VKRILIAVGILLIPILYCLDYGILHLRIHQGTAVYDNITVQTYYVIPRKDGKGEFDFGDPAIEVCVRTLFPQMGKRPCWYARRHSTKEIAP